MRPWLFAVREWGRLIASSSPTVAEPSIADTTATRTKNTSTLVTTSAQTPTWCPFRRISWGSTLPSKRWPCLTEAPRSGEQIDCEQLELQFFDLQQLEYIPHHPWTCLCQFCWVHGGNAIMCLTRGNSFRLKHEIIRGWEAERLRMFMSRQEGFISVWLVGWWRMTAPVPSNVCRTDAWWTVGKHKKYGDLQVVKTKKKSQSQRRKFPVIEVEPPLRERLSSTSSVRKAATNESRQAEILSPSVETGGLVLTARFERILRTTLAGDGSVDDISVDQSSNWMKQSPYRNLICIARVVFQLVIQNTESLNWKGSG